MDKKMFLVRVACDAAACIRAFACVSDHLECKKFANLKFGLSSHEPTS